MKAPQSGTLAWRPLAPTFGAQVLGAGTAGIDLARPLDAAARQEIAAALHRHRVLLFRDQRLSPDQLVEFTRVFGRVEDHAAEPGLAPYLLPGRPEVLVISNIFEGGRPVGYYNNDNEEWHADYSWHSGQASRGSMLYSVQAPAEGGATLFADSTTAFEELAGDAAARLAGLDAVHSLTYLAQRQRECTPEREPAPAEREVPPDVLQPLVRTHPVTGRRSLLLGTMEIRGIAGLGETEGRALLDGLTAHVAGDRYRYRHRWQVGDLVVWDNLAVLHAATYCDRHRFPRLLHRTTFVA
jgi:taurine dioxygenase